MRAMQKVGLDAALGTFLAGVVLAESSIEQSKRTSNIQRALWVSFYLSGASIDFSIIARNHQDRSCLRRFFTRFIVLLVRAGFQKELSRFFSSRSLGTGGGLPWLGSFARKTAFSIGIANLRSGRRRHHGTRHFLPDNERWSATFCRKQQSGRLMDRRHDVPFYWGLLPVGHIVGRLLRARFPDDRLATTPTGRNAAPLRANHFTETRASDLLPGSRGRAGRLSLSRSK